MRNRYLPTIFPSGSTHSAQPRCPFRTTVQPGSLGVFLGILWALAPIGRISAAEPEIDYNRDIRPILSDKCFSCHGFDPGQRKAGLRLDTAEGAYAPIQGANPAIKPGKPEASEAWSRIQGEDESLRMPPADSHKVLSAGEKALLKTWIAQGAKYSRHWSFVPPTRPPVPAGFSNGPNRNPIDAFIGQKLKAKGLSLSPEADRATLLRRLSLDLTGLPPSIRELDAFLADQAPGAYERQVDRLLASDHYGERMAAMWLDLARYGDTNGYLHDLMRTGWPWRDWVIRAFNKDMPFDRFVVEQLAGDLMPNAPPEQILATAFLRNHPITAEGGTIAAEYMNEYAADRVQTVATALMGLSFNCCRCHDHKFDPLSQEDFYSLQAYFNSTTEKHLENNQSPAYEPFIELASPLLLGGPKAKVMVMKEATTPKPTFVLTRGQYDQPNAMRAVSRRPPKVLAPKPVVGEQNRLTLAHWTVSRENPLIARVSVNRIWQRLFGIGLVATPDDFGLQGEFPSHPELLDYLAEEFREEEKETNGTHGNNRVKAGPWSTKHLIRLIVTSQTYRQDSANRPELTRVDPANRLLGHFPRHRLDAEQIRDQALFASGLLSPKLGGAPVYPYQPADMWEERSNEGSNTKVYKRSEGEALHRRSIYTFYKRTCPPPLMSVFDAPDRLGCSVRRVPTNTPLQALATLNDEQMLECARALGAKALREPGSDKDRLAQMFRSVVARAPSGEELALLEKTLSGLRTRMQKAPSDAEALLRQGITPVPDKIAKPDLAAWMLLASAVLNLDEALVRN